MKYFVYILYSKSLDRFYTGQTENLEQRLFKHNSGFVKSTKAGVPWEISFIEEVKSRGEAVKLERKIKARGA
ncbi:MAG: GIY-YIG nuclease family protein [Bacteroidota bacterium]